MVLTECEQAIESKADKPTAGAGNLFVLYGEPDIDVRKEKDGKLVVEIRGVDVYDPTTGQIRSHSTDEMACWFIDTAYSGASFFVRHARLRVCPGRPKTRRAGPVF